MQRKTYNTIIIANNLAVAFTVSGAVLVHPSVVLGCKARGRQRDGAFNHSTGRGWVKGKAGQYADALQTLLGGGCHHRGVRRHLTRSTNHYRAFIRRLADRSKGANATDRTRYGRLRGSTRSFMRHHIQHVVKAAVVGDSEAILRQITFLKQRVFGTAQAAAGGSARDGLGPASPRPCARVGPWVRRFCRV